MSAASSPNLVMVGHGPWRKGVGSGVHGGLSFTKHLHQEEFGGGGGRGASQNSDQLGSEQEHICLAAHQSGLQSPCGTLHW